MKIFIRKILNLVLTNNYFYKIDKFYSYLKRYLTYYSNLKNINNYINGYWGLVTFPFFGNGIFITKQKNTINIPRKYWHTLPMVADIISYGGYPSWIDGKIQIERDGVFLVSSPIDRSFAESIKEMFIVDEYRLNNKNIKGKTILDIGANIGDTAIVFSKLGAKKIYSFEPLTMLKEYLIENINLNGLNHIIEPHFVGLSDKDDTIDIWAMEFGSAGASAELHRQEVREYKPGYIKQTLQIRNAMNYFKIHNINDIDIIKMDCEMCEYALLKDDTLLKILDPELVMIEYHNKADSLISILGNCGYNCSQFPKNERVGIINAEKYLS